MLIFRVIFAYVQLSLFLMNFTHVLMRWGARIVIAFYRAVLAQPLSIPASGTSHTPSMSPRWKKPPSISLAIMTLRLSGQPIVRQPHQSKRWTTSVLLKMATASLLIASARSFLHHQIRNITGTLVQVGLKKWTPDDVKTALEAKHRSAAGPTAPAHGLYLTDVQYPE